ncbi:hypothetical protein [Streptomyces sp. CMB-StM0423]|uniref:hypothetical protein n=1 Tax=Streptomyces sp. CMB-StM0423 TaxID=2059884 RepID=UPI000C704B3A|nr:hypothetical protein [Streptomyces sp. CMB-StM0423]AUH43227.1 hypothetical protein CXR04_26410 [Streptomyces sp. CMB-StM0423]
MRAAAPAAVDDSAFEAYRAAYVSAAGIVQAAEYAREAVLDAFEATFQTVFRPIGPAAERARVARAAGHPVTEQDAAAWGQANAAGELAAAAADRYAPWQADRLLHHLSRSPTADDERHWESGPFSPGRGQVTPRAG